MKTIQALFLLSTLSIFCDAEAQTTKVNSTNQVEIKQNSSYYQQRAREDAQHEQEFKASTKKEERTFWKEQKEYEKNLKSENRVAYKVYIEAKNDAYAKHYHNCNNDCYHSDYYYQNAAYYYYGYREPRYNNTGTRATINTNVGVSTPQVKLGLF